MAKPLHSSRIPASALGKSPDLGLAGAGALGFTPMPVQTEIWKLLQAKRRGLPLYENTAIEVPRRAGKTEGLFSLAVGRCSAIDGYQIAYAAQSGIASRRRFLGLLRRLSRHGPGGWTAYKARGEEAINWDNGSTLAFYPPKAESWRGDAYDWIVLDEAQEVDEEDAADLLGSILPVFDTRPEAQLTVAGTAGEARSGLLWEALEKGRKGDWGILEYAMREGLDPEDEKVWLTVHPGPAGVSKARALEVLRKRFAQMSREMFLREYLGVWPEDATKAAFDRDVWQLLGRERGTQPRRIGIGFDCPPASDRPVVAMAWRDQAGLAHIEIAAEDTVDQIIRLARKYKVPVGHDTASPQTLNVADEIARRSRGSVKLRGLTTMEFAASCVTVDAAVREGTLRHFRQPELDQAIEVASRRQIRDAGWAWGRKVSSGSIASLVAGTVALRMYDDLPPARVIKALSARSA